MDKTKVVIKEIIYEVRGLWINFADKVRVDIETGKEIYDAELEQENDIALYEKHEKIILEELEEWG